MQRDELLLIDILEHARHVRDTVARHTRSGFDNDVAVRMGIAHLLQIVGEAARLLSEPERLRFATVPWHLIVGMRHKIVHEYFRTDFDVVWDTATIWIPQLISTLEPEIGPLAAARKASRNTP